MWVIALIRPDLTSFIPPPYNACVNDEACQKVSFVKNYRVFNILTRC
jgi:hypothetical protein